MVEHGSDIEEQGRGGGSAQQPHHHHHISLVHQGIAAAGASVVSAVVVNPLDVAKVCIDGYVSVFWILLTSSMYRCIMQTRIQSHVMNPEALSRQMTPLLAGHGSACSSSSKIVPSGGTGTVPFRGTIDALTRIARQEGVGVLWRGTGLSLTMAVPMVGIYLPLYDAMLEYAQKQGTGYYAPLLAGTAARSVAVYCTSPIELMRVRVQSVIHNTLDSSSHVTTDHRRILPSNTNTNTKLSLASRVGQMKHLWRGVGATLWRDVPFSGLYWALVEPIREQLVPKDGPTSEWQVFEANAIAGGVSGAIAGAITTPFDVVKTRMQVYHTNNVKTFSMMKDIFVSEGLAGLFKGWSARSSKAVPACAIVLSAYEMIKFFPMGRYD